MARPFYLAYFDLNHFKPYNDTYGFYRGDEVLCEVARLLAKQQDSHLFVGHVGEDNFVMIATCDPCEPIRDVIRNFEQMKSSFYHKSHWQAQHISAEDRQGNLCKHPLISLSAGVLTPRHTNTANQHELSALCALAKKRQSSLKMGFAC